MSRLKRAVYFAYRHTFRSGEKSVVAFISMFKVGLTVHKGV